MHSLNCFSCPKLQLLILCALYTPNSVSNHFPVCRYCYITARFVTRLVVETLDLLDLESADIPAMLDSLVEESAEIETVGEVGDKVDPRVSAEEESATEAAQMPAPATVDVADESMDEGEKAFNILVSLGMVEQTPDPDDAEYDNSKDDELAPHTNI